MDEVLQLSVYQVALAYAFVVVVLVIIRRRKIRREKELVIASLRMTLQLVLVGYMLVFLFGNPHPLLTLLVIAIMEGFAMYTVFRNFKKQLSRSLKKIISLSMLSGTLSCLVFFLLLIIQIKPWFDPRYFIPLAGMLIGNSMTGISLGIKSLLEGMSTGRSQVEQALILGATPQDATRDIINRTFDSAIMPTINSMLGMGIVFLPGMMTGQILSGTIPTTAIAYQIAIMLAILGAVSLTVIMLLHLGCRTFFNASDQLVE